MSDSRGLLAQHAHYTVDVLAAPFAAWLAHEVARRVVRSLSPRDQEVRFTGTMTH